MQVQIPYIVGWGNEFVYLNWKDKQDAKFENRSGLDSFADGLHHHIFYRMCGDVIICTVTFMLGTGAVIIHNYDLMIQI